MTAALPDVRATPRTFPDDWPALGLGCAPLGDLFEPIAEHDVVDLLEAAWQAGVRYFDTAPWYGHGLSEHRLGWLLRQHDRGGWIVSTKVGRVYSSASRGEDVRIRWRGGANFALRFDYTAAGFAASVEQSRLRLVQPCLDALVVHDLDELYHPQGLDRHEADLRDSGLPFLHDLKRRGEIAAIGIGINRLAEFERFAGTIDVDFFLVAMPYTLLDQTSLHGPMARCIERGVKVVVGAPFASGILTDPSDPAARYNYRPAEPDIREKALAIDAVCRRHDVPIAAAALQFPLLHPAVVSVVPGANTAGQVSANAHAARMTIPPVLWDELKGEGLIDPAAPTG